MRKRFFLVCAGRPRQRRPRRAPELEPLRPRIAAVLPGTGRRRISIAWDGRSFPVSCGEPVMSIGTASSPRTARTGE